MSREKWFESDNPNRHAWGIGRMLFVGFLAVSAVGVGVWGFNVATSDVKGAGDATVQINSGTNRIVSQEVLQSMYASILAYDKNLDQAAKDKADHPGDSFWETAYSGMVKACNSAVAQYNAETQKITRAKWRDATLPFQINSTDTTTDCKETEK